MRQTCGRGRRSVNPTHVGVILKKAPIMKTETYVNPTHVGVALLEDALEIIMNTVNPTHVGVALSLTDT